MTPITGVAAPYVMQRRRPPVAVFQLSESPDERWIKKFKERAILSHLDPFNFNFSGDELSVALITPMELSELEAAVDRIMRGANIDTGRA